MNFDTQVLLDAAMVGVPVFVGLLILKVILYRVIKKISQKTVMVWDDLVADVIGKFSWFFFLSIAIVSGWKFVSTVPIYLTKAFIIIAFLQVATISSMVVEFVFKVKMDQLENQNQQNILHLLLLGVKFLLYVAIFLVCLDNLGVDVTSLITGLGIGGIAIALAVQSTLTDLLSSLSIILDRPFEIGDAFEVDGQVGTVEKIGIKTTRVRALGGEQLIYPNSKLLQGQIRNYRRMEERRIVTTIGVIYETPFEKLKIIPEMIKKIIESQKDTRFDRAHFSNMNSYSLDFEIVYYVLSRDYNVFRDVHQAVLFDIFAAFAKEDLEFAYPTNVQYSKNIQLDQPQTES